MSGCGCEVELKDDQQKTVLYWLIYQESSAGCIKK